MPSVPHFDRRLSPQEQFDDLSARRVCGPVQTSYSLGHRVHLQTTLQQKLDDLSSSILASPRKATLHLRSARAQPSVLREEAFEQVEPSNSGRSLNVEGSPLFGEMLRCGAATISQAGVNESFTV